MEAWGWAQPFSPRLGEQQGHESILGSCRNSTLPCESWGVDCTQQNCGGGDVQLLSTVSRKQVIEPRSCPQVLGFSVVFPLGFRLPLDLLLFLSLFLFFFLQWGCVSSSGPSLCFGRAQHTQFHRFTAREQFALGWVIPWVSPISDLDDIWMRLWTLDFWVDAGPVKALGTIDIEWIYFAWKKNLSLGEWGWTTMVWMFVFSCFKPQGNGNRRWVFWEINRSLRGPSW